MTFPRTVLSALALAAALAAPLSADAARGRDGDGPVQIRFARGAVCWTYTGRAWEFTGRFAAGQTLTIRATGMATMGDGRRTWEEQQERFPTVSHHRGEPIDADDVDSNIFVIPRSGLYDISLWPHAMQGGLGTTRICAR